MGLGDLGELGDIGAIVGSVVGIGISAIVLLTFAPATRRGRHRRLQPGRH